MGLPAGIVVTQCCSITKSFEDWIGSKYFFLNILRLLVSHSIFWKCFFHLGKMFLNVSQVSQHVACWLSLWKVRKYYHPMSYKNFIDIWERERESTLPNLSYFNFCIELTKMTTITESWSKHKIFWTTIRESLNFCSHTYVITYIYYAPRILQNLLEI